MSNLETQEQLLKQKLAKAISDKAKADREIESLTSEIATLSIVRTVQREHNRQEFSDTGLAIGDRVRRAKATPASARTLIGVIKGIKQETLHTPKALCEFSDRSRPFWYFTDNLVRVTPDDELLARNNTASSNRRSN